MPQLLQPGFWCRQHPNDHHHCRQNKHSDDTLQSLAETSHNLKMGTRLSPWSTTPSLGTCCALPTACGAMLVPSLRAIKWGTGDQDPRISYCIQVKGWKWDLVKNSLLAANHASLVVLCRLCGYTSLWTTVCPWTIRVFPVHVRSFWVRHAWASVRVWERFASRFCVSSWDSHLNSFEEIPHIGCNPSRPSLSKYHCCCV